MADCYDPDERVSDLGGRLWQATTSVSRALGVQDGYETTLCVLQTSECIYRAYKPHFRGWAARAKPMCLFKCLVHTRHEDVFIDCSKRRACLILNITRMSTQKKESPFPIKIFLINSGRHPLRIEEYFDRGHALLRVSWKGHDGIGGNQWSNPNYLKTSVAVARHHVSSIYLLILTFVSGYITKMFLANIGRHILFMKGLVSARLHIAGGVPKMPWNDKVRDVDTRT